jgi:hypothetical protein
LFGFGRVEKMFLTFFFHHYYPYQQWLLDSDFNWIGTWFHINFFFIIIVACVNLQREIILSTTIFLVVNNIRWSDHRLGTVLKDCVQPCTLITLAFNSWLSSRCHSLYHFVSFSFFIFSVMLYPRIIALFFRTKTLR